MRMAIHESGKYRCASEFCDRRFRVSLDEFPASANISYRAAINGERTSINRLACDRENVVGNEDLHFETILFSERYRSRIDDT